MAEKDSLLRGRLICDLGLRVNYFPSTEHEDKLGDLRTTRAVEKVSHLQQVTPFQQWCPPSRRDLALPGLPQDTPFRTMRSHKNWLLKFQPEACIWDPEMRSLLSEEVTALKRPPESLQSTRLLAVGEVSDVRYARKAKGKPALAMAFGDSGHVLRIIGLSREEWAWADKDVSICLNSLDSQEEGRWSHNQTPITLVKFMVDRNPRNPIRWVAVQNALSTTIFGPEIRMLPSQIRVQDPHLQGTFKIHPNPLFSIPAGRTGSAPQCDVAFNPAGSSEDPQIAIIDQNGTWSIWDITHNRLSRPREWKPILRLCGDFKTGSIPRIPHNPNNTAIEKNRHRISWVPLASNNDGAQLQASVAQQSDADADEEPFIPVTTCGRLRALLLCDDAALRIFDTRTKMSHPVLDIIPPKDPYRVLDVRQCPLRASQSFILTKTAVLWVATTIKDGTIHPSVILTCPHEMDKTDDGLNMSVSLDHASKHTEACFVCVRSVKGSHMTIIRFIIPEDGTSFQHHRWTVNLEKAGGHVSLLVLPLRRTERTQGGIYRTKARPIDDGTCFYQFLALGPDLDLSCSLCALSDEPSANISSPDVRVSHDDTHQNERRRLVQYVSNTFTVSDEFDERAVLQSFQSSGADHAFLRPWKNKQYKLTDLKLSIEKEVEDPPEDILDGVSALRIQSSPGQRQIAPIRMNSSSPPPPAAQPRDDWEGSAEALKVDDEDTHLLWLDDCGIYKTKGWELGSDSSQVMWMSQDQKKDLEMTDRLRKRQEVIRRKKERRIASLRPSHEGSSTQPTQPLPPMFLFSQPRASSQGLQSQVFDPIGSSQPMSQVVPGVFGMRPPRFKKQKIRKEPRSGFR